MNEQDFQKAFNAFLDQTRQTIAKLEIENANLKRQNASMAGHPDVIAAKKAAALTQATALEQQAKKLRDENGK